MASQNLHGLRIIIKSPVLPVPVPVADQKIHDPHLVNALAVYLKHPRIRVNSVHIAVRVKFHSRQDCFLLRRHTGAHADIFVLVLPCLIVDMLHIHFVQQIGTHHFYS